MAALRVLSGMACANLDSAHPLVAPLVLRACHAAVQAAQDACEADTPENEANEDVVFAVLRFTHVSHAAIEDTLQVSMELLATVFSDPERVGLGAWRHAAAACSPAWARV